ncbi:MAG: CocE/NonD family hydrolase, partial [Nocardioidaceae bacterium]
MRHTSCWALLGSAAALAVSLAPVAQAVDTVPHDTVPHDTVPHVEGTRTVPAYDYGRAIRESVLVEVPVDSDRDGEPDRVAVDIIRPREAAEAGVDVPVIMDASPYYQCCGRGNESEVKVYGPDGVPTKFPLFYDNYFVPRGYAFAAVDLSGTARSTGCEDIGGSAEIASAKAAIDWLNGRARGHDLEGDEVTADWTTGKVGMIGKSWDGSVANGVAATGVEGLETIVPIAAISSWYNYTRANGTLIAPGYASFLHEYVNGRPPQDCAHLREELAGGPGDDTGNYTGFWADRDYVPSAERMEASVFLVHGLGDANVKTINVGPYWEALARSRVPRKIWLARTGHVDPFDFRRADWVDTLHSWFDHWLQSLDNGIMRQPSATVERASGQWVDQATWPARGTRDVHLSLGGPAAQGRGTLTLRPARTRETVTVGPEGQLTFSSAELDAPVSLAGTPELHLRIRVDRPTTAVRTRLIEHGSVREVDSNIETLESESCWGSSTPEDDACYHDTAPVVSDQDDQQITFGTADVAHWSSLSELTPLEPDRWYDLGFPVNSLDSILAQGHRLSLEMRLGSPGYTA